jgi:protein-tyrosine phosphatase
MRILQVFGSSFATVVDRVARGATIVAHCHAGKDRTGLVAMLMLGLAGVSDGDLLDDYEISERHRDHEANDAYLESLEALGHDPADFAPMFGSPRAVMRDTVESLRREWGSFAGYLSDAGLAAVTLEAAREALVVDH